MKIISMKNTLTVIASTLFTVQAYASCLNTSDKDIQYLIDKALIQYRIPGAEVSISCSNESQTRDFVGGTVMMNAGAPVQTNTYFQIGSETKSFVAVTMLKLESEGVLSIDDKLGKWLPQINPQWKDISIKQLLNHTSGIYNYVDVIAELIHTGKITDLNKQWSAQDLVELVTDRPLYFKPGQGWHYSNTNYVLAGMIIEAATKQSIDEQIYSRWIKPLNLTNTLYQSTSYNSEILKRMAHGYCERGLLPNEPTDITYINHSWTNAAGGLISNAHDMVTWVRKVSRNELLPIPQMIELTSLVDENNGQPIPVTSQHVGYALGLQHDFDTFAEESWWHSGSTLGYNSVVTWLKPSDVVIAVNVNHYKTAHDAVLIAQALAKLISSNQ